MYEKKDMIEVTFTDKMSMLYADTYSLTNDIEDVMNKANALVFKVLQSQGYKTFADTYQAIVNEYQEQMKMKEYQDFNYNKKYNVLI